MRINFPELMPFLALFFCTFSISLYIQSLAPTLFLHFTSNKVHNLVFGWQ